MSERIEYVCNNKSDCHHCHLLEEIKYGNSIVVCDEVLTGPNMIYDLEQENAKIKAELEKSQCMLAGFMVAEDQEKARLKERVALLENVREAVSKAMNKFGTMTWYRLSHEHDETTCVPTIQWKELLYQFHEPVYEALKNCEATDDKQD